MGSKNSGVRGARPSLVVIDEVMAWSLGTDEMEAGVVQRQAEQRRANFTRKQLDAIDWSAVPPSFGRRRMQLGAWKVWTTGHIEFGACYVNTTDKVLVLHPQTWDVVGYDVDTQNTFLTAFTSGASGMKWLDLNTGPYAAAFKALAAAERGTVAAQESTGDALDGMAALANRLIVEASGMSTSNDPHLLAIFMDRLEQLRGDLVKVEKRVSKVRSLVELAGEAVFGAV